MTILHKCSKTHGHHLVFLVTSWLRRKAEKCDRTSWAGLWCLPWLRLAGGWAVQAHGATLALGLLAAPQGVGGTAANRGLPLHPGGQGWGGFL